MKKLRTSALSNEQTNKQEREGSNRRTVRLALPRSQPSFHARGLSTFHLPLRLPKTPRYKRQVVYKAYIDSSSHPMLSVPVVSHLRRRRRFHSSDQYMFFSSGRERGKGEWRGFSSHLTASLRSCGRDAQAVWRSRLITSSTPMTPVLRRRPSTTRMPSRLLPIWSCVLVEARLSMVRWMPLLPQLPTQPGSHRPPCASWAWAWPRRPRSRSPSRDL